MSGNCMKRVLAAACCLLSLAPCVRAEGFGVPEKADGLSESAARMAEKADDGVEFFVRAVPDRSEVILGDSCVVSYVLYASAPLSEVESKDEVKVRNARLRRLNIRREATAGYVVENGRRYHTLVWAQYVVVPARTGEIVFPACKFKAVLSVPEPARDPFEAFFSRRRVREIKMEASNGKSHIKVKEKPRRTTKEMLRGNGSVM